MVAEQTEQAFGETRRSETAKGSMSDYQHQLTQARRTALWRALRRHEDTVRVGQGKRADQVVFSLVVLVGCAAIGAALGAAWAVWEAWRLMR